MDKLTIISIGIIASAALIHSNLSRSDLKNKIEAHQLQINGLKMKIEQHILMEFVPEGVEE